MADMKMKVMGCCITVILICAACMTGAAEQVALRNPGFEDDLCGYTVTGASGDGKQFFAADAEASQGKKSLVCLPVSEKVVLRAFGLPLNPEKQYRLTVSMKALEAAYGGGGVFIINEGWAWSTQSLRPVTPTSGWKDYAVTFRPRASTNGKYTLIIWGPSEGKVWVDNIRLEEDSTLLLNGGFENDLLGYEAVSKSGEAKRYFMADSSGCTEGVKSLMCLPSEEKISLRQFNIGLDTSKKYVLSVSLKTQEADFGQDRGICIIDNGWNWATPFLRTDTPTQEWKEYSVTFQPKASSNGKYALVVGVPVKGKLWVDNIRLTEAP